MPFRAYTRVGAIERLIQNNLKRGFQCLFGLTRRVGAIERLIQTFDAKSDLNEKII
jgi:hypothetical protein